MNKYFKNNYGYTLVELLAVIIIIVVVGGIMLGILTSSLRGGNRSTTVNDVRQSGNYALTQMSKMIAYSKVFEGVSDGTVDGNGNLIYQTDCVPASPPAPTPTPTPSSYSYLKILSFDGGETVFSCLAGGTQSIASNGASMINTSGINIASCSFSCTQSSLATPPTIDINFTLSKSNGGLFGENQTSIPFSTSVTFRNN